MVERVKRARGQVKSARARLLRVSSMLFFFSLRQTRFFVHVPFSCSRGMRMCSIVIEFAAEERSVDEGEPGDCAVLYSPLAQLRVCIIEIELIYNDSGLKGAGGKKRDASRTLASSSFFRAHSFVQRILANSGGEFHPGGGSRECIRSGTIQGSFAVCVRTRATHRRIARW